MGVGVTAVHEAVHIDLVEAFLLRHSEELVEVVEAGVHAAMGAEAHEMELSAAVFHIIVCRAYLLIVEELVVAAGHIDLHEVLIYDSTGAEIHVADLRVAHLAVGQADVLATGLEVGHGVFRAETVDEGGALRVDCIRMVVASFSPAVQNHQ